MSPARGVSVMEVQCAYIAVERLRHDPLRPIAGDRLYVWCRLRSYTVCMCERRTARALPALSACRTLVFVRRRSMPSITYRADERPDVRRIVELYRAAQLRRPVDDPDRIARTYEGSPIVLSAWDAARLVGILRGWTDGAFDGYICDLAVDPEYQKQGVGRELLRLCVAHSPDVQ